MNEALRTIEALLDCADRELDMPAAEIEIPPVRRYIEIARAQLLEMAKGMEECSRN